ncbi:MAG: hypothetical protein EA408_11975 [Marinilabiliales bacterium]|nr:MAG: hypothetical protein EA408_11975 [Marinilabiliales bacterium]
MLTVNNCRFSQHNRDGCLPGPFAGKVTLFLAAMMLLVFVFTSSFTTPGRDIRIVRYSLEDGLSQISVSSIILDSYGFLWVGTQYGLNQFDGYGFRTFKHQPSDRSSLSNSTINSVIEDDRGNLWVATDDGLNVFDRKSETFTVYRHDSGDRYSLNHNRVTGLFRDSGGAIWIKTPLGLDRFDPASGVFENTASFDPLPGWAEENGGEPIYEDSRGRLWIGSHNGLLLFDRIGGHFQVFRHDRDDQGSISSNNVRAVFETSGGDLLIGTDNGLNIFHPGKQQFVRFFPGSYIPAGSEIDHINHIYEDINGTVWTGTNGGLFSFSPVSGEFGTFTSGRGVTPFLNVEVTSVTEDNSGNLWVGTLGGLFMADAKNKFRSYSVHDYMPGAVPAARIIASISLAGDDELWVGTWGGGLFRIKRTAIDAVHYSSMSPATSRRISNDFVHVIFRRSDGSLILGTRDGLDIYLGEDIGFVPYCPSDDPGDCSVFKSNRVYSVMEDSRQVMWVATRNGLYAFDNGEMFEYLHDPDDVNSISSNQVHDIKECSNGYIWLATARGLNRYDREARTFISYLKNPDMGRFSLSNNEVTAIHEDAGGNLWIGTVAGLNRFFPRTGSFMVFSELEGLPDNLIYAIAEDDNGRLWLSTNNGIARFDPDNFEVISFDVDDGLQDYEFNLGAVYKSENGEIFFGGVSGFNSFYPDSILYNDNIPPVAITSFEVQAPGYERFVPVTGTEEIILQPYENSFSIEFAALDFTRPNRNRYSYTLEGLEDSWIYPGTRRVAGFNRVPPGTYMFRVRGSNNDGIWNEEGASFRIVVVTPWWMSGYAYGFYGITVLGLIYIIVMFSTIQLRTANQVLREKEQASQEVARQKEELSLKNRNITDSINYARRIQMAMMPKSRQLQRHFPDSFIFYSPKDIVSGDFFWVSKRRDKVFVAVVDCTGHGVPGAFMSIIGYELLRNIINVKGIESPAGILNELNVDFSKIFDSEGEKDYSFRDGMDIGFIVIDRGKSLLEFSGAFSPMYLIRDMSITEVKGNRFPVGIMEDLIGETFTNHTIHLEKDDMIYLFSDGYPDQFGGVDGKKFKFRRFRHLLLNIHKLPASQQQDMLEDSMIHWMGSQEQVDDILVIGIRPGLDHA